VNVGDTYFLLGKYYYYANAEFILPLNAVIHVFPFSGLQGVAGFDFGGVAPSVAAYFDRRVLDAVLGVNLGLGALIFRLHFARPINIGVLTPSDGWVTNFSLRLAGFDFGNAFRAHSGQDGPVGLTQAMVK
jgi:hypothetical protein